MSNTIRMNAHQWQKSTYGFVRFMSHFFANPDAVSDRLLHMDAACTSPYLTNFVLCDAIPPKGGIITLIVPKTSAAHALNLLTESGYAHTTGDDSRNMVTFLQSIPSPLPDCISDSRQRYIYKGVFARSLNNQRQRIELVIPTCNAVQYVLQSRSSEST